MRYPHIIRLYRVDPKTLLGESDVVDLWINGQIYWYLNPPMNKVRVGRDVVFKNIPPECTDCPPPPGFRRHTPSAFPLRSRLAPLQ